MGDVVVVDVADNAALQRALTERILAAKGDDPFAPVTLVVDSPAVGWALRRQLVCGWPAGAGVANLRTLTLNELMAELAAGCGIATPGQGDTTLRVAVTESFLRSDTGPLMASRDHPDTALRLAALGDQLIWCTLDPASLATLEPGVSATARAAIDFAAGTRGALAETLDESDWPTAATGIAAALTTDQGELASARLGTVLVCSARMPAVVRDVVAALARHGSVVRFVLAPPDEPIAARVLSCPDPATEASIAVRFAADAIGQDVALDDIAILYATDLPYARLLEDALAAAKIEWHGPTGQTLTTTSVARYALCLAQMTADRSDGGSGITRPALMRWFGIGTVHDGEKYLPTGSFRALIRQEGLFGDAVNWLPRLSAMAAAVEADPSDDEDSMARRRNRLAPHAAPLSGLIAKLDAALDAALDAIADSPSWTELGQRMWSALETFHLKGTWWQVRGLDQATVEAIRSILLESLPAIDAFRSRASNASMPPDAADVVQMLSRALGDRRGRHGASTTGIHVGPLPSARGLVFGHVIIVGAAEGMLPAVRGDDPLLPLVARTLLRREPDDLPTSLEAEALTANDVRALCTPSATTVAMFARGGLPGRAVGLPSRYLPGGKPEEVGSARSSLAIDPPPVAGADLAIRAGIGRTDPPAELDPMTRSLAAWANPEFGVYFGNLGEVDGQPAWALHEQRLSASGIESFLHCPYHFFVQRVLGISTDEYEDEVDTMAPSDIGTMLHRAFERLVVESQERGTLPGFGEPWPASTLADLRALLDDEVAAAQAVGLTGWQPAWRRTYDTVVASLPPFLEIDATQVRQEPPMRPEAAERGFGDGGSVVEFRVSDDVVVRLRGSIDRVDTAADGSTVGVVDYKSGSAKKWDTRLGMPNRKGVSAEREKVQDLVYDAAVRALYPDVEQVDVTFFFVPNRGDGPTVIQPRHDADRAESLRAVLGALGEAGARGTFMPKPGGRFDYCPVCKRLGRRALLVSGSIEDVDDADGPEAAS
jgi:RecB family exonuclease